MILLINLDGPEDPGLARFAAALGAAGRRPLVVVTPQLADARSGQELTVDRGLRVTPVHAGKLFCFAVDGTPADLLPLALDVICPAPPRLVIMGPTRLDPPAGSPRAAAGLVPAIRAATRGLPVLVVEWVPGETAWQHPSAACCAYAAAAARTCRSLSGLAGTVLRLRLPAVPAACSAPRFAAFAPPAIPTAYRPMRQGDDPTTWQLVGDQTPDDDDETLEDGVPLASILAPDPGKNPQEVADLFLARWSPPAG